MQRRFLGSGLGSEVVFLGKRTWPRRRVRAGGRRFGRFFFCALLAASARADIPLPFAPPLIALDRRADVADGGRVEIPLGVNGAAQGNTYEFIIRAPPTKGRLDYLRAAVAGDTAVVSYTHNPTLGGGTDSFTYAVQRVGGNGPASASARVDLRIADALPRLLPAPDTLDFGVARAGGGRTRRTFTLQNLGGPATGRVAPPAPWSVEGADTYRLRRGQSTNFTVVFTPPRAGHFEGALAFGGLRGQVLRLVAAGEPSLAGTGQTSTAAATAPSAGSMLLLPPTAEAGPRVEFAPPARAPATSSTSPAGNPFPPARGGAPAAEESDAASWPNDLPRAWISVAGGDWPLDELRLADGPTIGGRATLRWKPPPTAPAAYRVERRELSLDDAHRLQVRWWPLVAEILAPDAAGLVSARVHGLPAGAGTVIRVQALDATGTVRGRSAGLFLDPPVPLQTWIWMTAVGFLGVAALAAILLARRRRSRGN